jgi:predicted ATP-dependent protease
LVKEVAMPEPKPLSVEALAWRCPEQAFAGLCETPSAEGVPLGQDRAVEALRFALDLGDSGYNVFAMGPEALGKRDVVLDRLHAHAAAAAAPPDLCYVNNFTEARRPRLLVLPAGTGRALRADMTELVRGLKPSLSAAFENEEYRTQKETLEQGVKDRQEQAIHEVEAHARERSVVLQRTPMGFAFMPMKDGEVIPPDDFNKLPDDERQRFRDAISELERELQAAVRQFPKWVSEVREQVRDLSRRTADHALGHLFDPLFERYGAQEAVHTFLDGVRTDILDHVESILEINDEGFDVRPENVEQGHDLIRRYLVNLLVDSSARTGAPVVVEDDPTYDRLFGRIEHKAQMGALSTDLHLVRDGALHRANGGYLVLEVQRLLTRPFAWDALTRALERGEVMIEPPMQSMGLMSTTTLEPQPLPLQVKVVLLGSRLLYHLLRAYEPKFQRLFKVAADFEEEVRHDDGRLEAFGRERRAQAEADKLLPIASGGLARLAEHAARLSGDRDKLSTERETLADILREADVLARRGGCDHVDRAAVDDALEARRHRLGRPHEKSLELITDGTVQIATDGEATGQINGLAVVDLGEAGFGKPSRISARVRMGSAGVVDIEREAKLGGPIHSKGVLILSGYLSAHYAGDVPLSLHASLVFEQSYGGVDGDSASSAELYALLSALAQRPLRQDLAVTGAVDQYGAVQAIGGVNEKIEGFFDLCEARGLTGRQGVLIPAANRRHLMLHERVRAAVADGRFHIYPVEHVDQGLELLTGTPAGARGDDGRFAAGSVHDRADRRLREFAEHRRAFGVDGGGLRADAERNG